ncbi:hypothetical protein M378DRAFT_596284 [Amanita muscaria Koide BX008]|uniref:Uncharacterized protein n=1 Tax=Amanita muscaria (strain Koide BX008) TaxID=946122 RepID=A0A0C2X545_AMAMK|nr:hypothetical protein M378DRAFT_596284 [Amanita muscaria Koide BX008]
MAQVLSSALDRCNNICPSPHAMPVRPLSPAIPAEPPNTEKLDSHAYTQNSCPRHGPSLASRRPFKLIPKQVIATSDFSRSLPLLHKSLRQANPSQAPNSVVVRLPDNPLSFPPYLGFSNRGVSPRRQSERKSRPPQSCLHQTGDPHLRREPPKGDRPCLFLGSNSQLDPPNTQIPLLHLNRSCVLLTRSTKQSWLTLG